MWSKAIPGRSTGNLPVTWSKAIPSRSTGNLPVTWSKAIFNIKSKPPFPLFPPLAPRKKDDKK
jgi:hypothetical protein